MPALCCLLLLCLFTTIMTDMFIHTCGKHSHCMRNP